jgi:hypothetical protein
MITRRTLLKLVGLFPLAGPTIIKALATPSLKPKLTYGLYLPAHFPKWDQATDGLEEAGKWALELERSRLPSDTIFPCAGQVWEAVRDCEVSFRPCFSSTRITGGQLVAMLGGRAQLRQGELVRILGTDNPKPIYVTFSPVRHRELEDSIVPEEFRILPGYRDYQLQAKTAKTVSDFDKKNLQTYFNETFRLVENVV